MRFQRSSKLCAALAPWLLSCGCDAGTASLQPEPPSTPEEPSEPVPKPDCVLKSSRIEKDTTLYKACSPYILKRGGLDVVDDAVLTIEPGVEVRFKDGDWLEISAAFTKGAGIRAIGTKEDPIVLTSQTPDKAADGTWFGLWLNEGTAAGSVISNVIIRVAGGDNAHIKPTLVHGCLTLTDIPDGRVKLENITLESCANAGLVLRRTKPELSKIRVIKSAVGVLLDGVPSDFVDGAEVSYEAVTKPVLEGPSARPPME
jgi:hypothetical protein